MFLQDQFMLMCLYPLLYLSFVNLKKMRTNVVTYILSTLCVCAVQPELTEALIDAFTLFC